MKKRVLAMFLALVLCMTLLPVAVGAEDDVALEDGAPVQHADLDGEEVDPVDMPADESDEENEALDKKDEAEEKKDETEDKKDEAADKKDETADKKDETADKKDETADKKDEAADKKDEATDKKDEVADEKDDTKDKDNLQSNKDFVITNGVLTKYVGTDKNVVIPDGVTRIGDSAFFECNHVRSVTIPNSVQSIEERAFEYCLMDSVVIPEGVTSIARRAFARCYYLDSVTIPASVTSIGKDAFVGCNGLDHVYYGGTKEQWKKVQIAITSADLYFPSIGNGYLFAATVHYAGENNQKEDVPEKELSKEPEEEFVIKNGELIKYNGTSGDVVVPDGVTRIAARLFDGHKYLWRITLPDSVTSIGEYAFRNCKKLDQIKLGSNLTEIPRGLFYGCEALSGYIGLGSQITSIGDEAFYGCISLKGLTIRENVTSIGRDIVGNCPRLERIKGYGNTEAAAYSARNMIPFESMGLAPGSEPDPDPVVPAMIAYPSTQTVEVDGQKVEFQCYALKDANGNDTNYIKLRDLADILNGSAAQFQVGWDGDVTIATKQSYTRNGSERSTPFSGQREYKKAAGRTLIDGTAKDLAAFVLNDDNGGGYTYYQLRDLGQNLGFNVGWSAGRGIYLETNKPYDANN